MTGQDKTDGKVIKLALKKRRPPTDYSLSPIEKKTKTLVPTPVAEEPRRDPILSYLGKLPRKRPGRDALISWQEHAKICRATEPLRTLLPFVDTDTVLDVMNEYTEPPKPTANQLAKKEEALWMNAIIEEEELIPRFDFMTAHVNFKVSPEQRTNRVLFLKDEFAKPVEPPEVPLKLVKGEMYFFIVLRMYRKQHEKDFAEATKKTNKSKRVSVDRLP
ncbi:MAG: hypothetical protein AAB575_05180 [Patescibacteria group bacterium]